jgi:hypothetical protein
MDMTTENRIHVPICWYSIEYTQFEKSEK